MELLKREAMEDGRAEGRAKGREEGREEGIEITKNEVASNMIQEGLPTSQISRITGLDVNSIHQLTLRK